MALNKKIKSVNLNKIISKINIHTKSRFYIFVKNGNIKIKILKDSYILKKQNLISIDANKKILIETNKKTDVNLYYYSANISKINDR